MPTISRITAPGAEGIASATRSTRLRDADLRDVVAVAQYGDGVDAHAAQAPVVVDEADGRYCHCGFCRNSRAMSWPVWPAPTMRTFLTPAS